MSVDNINTAQRIFDETWNQGKLGLIDELCAEGYIDHDPLLGDADREAIKARISGYRAASLTLSSRSRRSLPLAIGW